MKNKTKLEGLMYTVRQDEQNKMVRDMYAHTILYAPSKGRDKYLTKRIEDATKLADVLVEDCLKALRKNNIGDYNRLANRAQSYYTLADRLGMEIIPIRR